MSTQGRLRKLALASKADLKPAFLGRTLETAARGGKRRRDAFRPMQTPMEIYISQAMVSALQADGTVAEILKSPAVTIDS